MAIRLFNLANNFCTRHYLDAIRSGMPAVLYTDADEEFAEDFLKKIGNSPQEIARSTRFYQKRDQRVHLLGRAMIRMIVSELCGLQTRKIQIAVTPHGKPFLDNLSLDFSISHSARWVACGVLAEGRIGIDIELDSRRLADNISDMGGLVLNELERRQLNSVPTCGQMSFFLDIWRRKEALIKATGLGFSLDPRTFSVIKPGGAMKASITLKDAEWIVSSLEREAAPVVAVAWRKTCEFH